METILDQIDTAIEKYEEIRCASPNLIVLNNLAYILASAEASRYQCKPIKDVYLYTYKGFDIAVIREESIKNAQIIEIRCY